MFSIKVHYTTGDSFGSEERTELVGYSWPSLDEAKKALSYIKEHYQAYIESSDWNKPRPYTVDHLKDKPWFFSGDDEQHPIRDAWMSLLKIPDGEGGMQVIGAFWCGYFECMHSARIVLDLESDPEAVFTP